MAKRKQSPAQLANLKKGKATQFVKGDARAKIGHIYSNRVQAKKRSMAEWAQVIGNLQGHPDIIEKLKKNFIITPEEEKDITNNGLAVIKLQDEMLKGNLQAYNLWLDLTGQKAAQKHEIISQQTIDIKSVKNLKKLLDD